MIKNQLGIPLRILNTLQQFNSETNKKRTQTVNHTSADLKKYNRETGKYKFLKLQFYQHEFNHNNKNRAHQKNKTKEFLSSQMFDSFDYKIGFIENDYCQ